MTSIIAFINTLAPLILVGLGFGIMFGVIRLKSVGFFLLFIMLLPFLGSAITEAFTAGVSGGVSWKIWLVMLLVVLFAIRMFIDGVFRR